MISFNFIICQNYLINDQRLTVTPFFAPLLADDLAGESNCFFVSASSEETRKANEVRSSCTWSINPHSSSMRSSSTATQGSRFKSKSACS